MGETNMSLEVGKKIQELRVKANDSQEALAAKLNISRQAISKWENNQSIPDITMLKSMSNLYGVQVSYFTNDENEQAHSPHPMRSLFLPDTLLYRFLLASVSVLSVLFFSIFSLFLTIPLFYINLRKKRYLWAGLYFVLIIFGLHILFTILFPGLMPYTIDVTVD